MRRQFVPNFFTFLEMISVFSEGGDYSTMLFVPQTFIESLEAPPPLPLYHFECTTDTYSNATIFYAFLQSIGPQITEIYANGEVTIIDHFIDYIQQACIPDPERLYQIPPGVHILTKPDLKWVFLEFYSTRPSSWHFRRVSGVSRLISTINGVVMDVIFG
jgi:hypothetical protein